MAFIITSKNKARPEAPRFSGRVVDYSDSIGARVRKSESEIASQRAWMSKNETERTKIAVEQAKDVARKSIVEGGGEIKDSNKFESFFARAAELKDRKE